MEFVDSARGQLAPLAQQVIDALDADSQPLELSFFTLILIRINGMQADMDLMNVFLELSTTAFQGFVFSREQSRRIDELLGAAEDIALTLSVSSDQSH
ncbi:MAG TPA: hypothetical protein VIS76_12840 [Pseudomonadales bacterium]